MSKTYLGLDIGTASVGVAVTDDQYHIKSHNDEPLFWSYLFESGQTAATRRQFRSSRRMKARRQKRAKWLNQQLPYRIPKNPYPTVYHLRQALIDGTAPKKPGLVKLAILHIFNHRGHFLFNNFDATTGTLQHMLPIIGIPYEDDVVSVLFDDTLSNKEKKSALKDYLSTLSDDDAHFPVSVLVDTLVSGKFNLKKAFAQIEHDYDLSIPSLDLSSEDFEDRLDSLNLSTDHYQWVLDVKNTYDAILLEKLLQNSSSISDAMIQRYNQHKEDLNTFKRLLPREDYYHIFMSNTCEHGYRHYVNNITSKEKINNKIKSFDLNKFVNMLLAFPQVKELYPDIKDRLERNILFPLQSTTYNAIIPNQLHLMELEQILDKAKAYMPELSKMDKNYHLTLADKIIQMASFKMPYFVGVTDPDSPYSWVERTQPGNVYPWNLHEKVDLIATRQNFINRLIGSCTYLPQYPVMPAQSVLYAKASTLNLINTIYVDGRPITVDEKKDVFHHLFKNNSSKQVTISQIARHLNTQSHLISGIDISVPNPFASIRALTDLIPNQSDSVYDEIITQSTVFSDETDLLYAQLKTILPHADHKTLMAITKLSFSGWGRLSRELLTTIEAPVGGVTYTLIEALYETNHSLMTLLSSSFAYQDQISQLADASKMKTYLSPSVKRQVNQVKKMVDRVLRHTSVDKIFIEMARGERDIPVRTVDRKSQLLEAYPSDHPVKPLLESVSNSQLKSRVVYLYFKQFGRCVYTGNVIDFNQIHNANMYDIDHVYPQSKVKDDSFNNLVLVTRQANMSKSNTFPIHPDIQKRQKPLWDTLRKAGLMSDTLYARLVRTQPFTPVELANFINRQLVETRQTTKYIANALKQLYPNIDIVYVKAQLTSDLRHHLDLPKVRIISDYHHAQDAYLTIIAGNAHDTKFTKNPYNFVRRKESYNLKRFYNFKIANAWDPEVTPEIILQTMYSVKPLIQYKSEFQSGALYNQTLYSPHRKASSRIPRKKDSNPDKEGYYTGNTAGMVIYFTALNDSGETVSNQLSVPLRLMGQFKNNDDICSYIHQMYPGKYPTILTTKRVKTILQPVQVGGKTALIVGCTGKSSVAFKNHAQIWLPKHLLPIMKRIEKVRTITALDAKRIPDMVNDLLSDESDNMRAILDILFDTAQNLFAMDNTIDDLISDRPNRPTDIITLYKDIVSLIAVMRGVTESPTYTYAFKSGSKTKKLLPSRNVASPLAIESFGV